MPSLLSLLLTASPLAAVATPAPALQHEELLTLWIADSDQLLSHPKDRGFASVFALVRPRLEELPAEFPDAQYPPQMVAWATAFLGNAKSLRIGRDDDASPVPLALQLDWSQDDAETAARTSAELAGFLGQMGAPVQEASPEGWVPVEAPMPLPVGFGPHGDAVTLGVGTLFEGPVDLSAPLLPSGVAPNMIARLDVSSISDLVLENMSMAAPEEAAIAEQVVSLLALDELSMHLESGSDDTHTHTMWTMPGYGAALRTRGVLPETGISLAHVKAVPVDALWASLVRVELQGVLDLALAATADLLAAEGIDDPVEMFTQVSGIHIERDILDHLGATFGMYASDTTGGGGLASTVAFLEVTDPAGLLPFLERMQGLANGIGFAEADGYVQVRGWEREGTRCWTLTFPGLPVPLEVSMALSGDLLMFGATPMALVTAMDQAAGASTSLLEHPGFRASIAGDPAGSFGIGFIDTPRTIRDGYSAMSMVASALVNGTRSLRDETRDAGMIMPSYHELMNGAQATASVLRLVDGDLISYGRSDASMAVNLTGNLGYTLQNPMFLAGLASGFFSGMQQSSSYEVYPPDRHDPSLEWEFELEDETAGDTDDQNDR